METLNLTDGTTVTLTEKEVAMVNAILTDDYNTYGVEGSPWSWSVAGNHSRAAVLGSLVKKGICFTQDTGRDAICGFKQEAKAAILAHFPNAQ